MKKRPAAVYWEDHDSIYLRFEGITYAHFNTILYSFKNRVPNVVWYPDLKAWKLPKTELQEVAVFAHEMFGRASLHFRGDKPPEQLELPWDIAG